MVGCESHTFDIGLSLAIVQKGFEKSFKGGLVAAKSETQNLITALKEKLTPKTARFDNVVTYELKDGIAYWQGDSMPVAGHLTRNTKLLSLRGAPEELVNQAKRDQDVWDAVQSRLSQLKPGQAIQYLSQKDADPNHGIALQQIVNDNGILKHQSHLLPFNDIDQINKFLSFASQGRRDLSLSIDPSTGLSDISGWIAAGDKIDFDQELPLLIGESMMPGVPLMNWQETVLPIWPQTTQEASTRAGVQPENRIASVEPSSFWWQILAAQVGETTFKEPAIFSLTSRTDLVGSKTVEVPKDQIPTRLDLEGITKSEPEKTVGQRQQARKLPTRRLLVGNQEKAVVVVFEAPIVKPTVINSKPKQHLYSAVVKARGCFSETKILEKPEIATIVFEPTRMFLEGYKGQEEVGLVEDTEPVQFKPEPVRQHPADTAGNNRDRFPEAAPIEMPAGTVPAGQEKEPVTKKGERLIITSVTAKQPSAMKIEPVVKQEPEKYQAAAIKDIPEWVWQGTAAIPDEIIDWPWFLVTMFYALLNTKVLLKEEARENFSLNQGSGFSFLEEKVN